ncbi:hypothetical protein [Luteibacter rhizovicinus]|uniref:hypothetical protein n=1 Tax=Luteibacter rhizovicinus TaxID=242606 RepID=UPI001050A22C|nr:hypothetical protein [Luteibacter rhizovicinus]
MKEANEAKTTQLLLGFCHLSKAEQNHFVDGLNRFLFVSPDKRRQLIERWTHAGKVGAKKAPR